MEMGMLRSVRLAVARPDDGRWNREVER